MVLHPEWRDTVICVVYNYVNTVYIEAGIRSFDMWSKSVYEGSIVVMGNQFAEALWQMY